MITQTHSGHCVTYASARKTNGPKIAPSKSGCRRDHATMPSGWKAIGSAMPP